MLEVNKMKKTPTFISLTRNTQTVYLVYSALRSNASHDGCSRTVHLFLHVSVICVVHLSIHFFGLFFFFFFLIMLVCNGFFLECLMFSCSPKGGQGCLMSPSCLESQGRHLISLFLSPLQLLYRVLLLFLSCHFYANCPVS